MSATRSGDQRPRAAEISVAISTRDRPRALARCLESLRGGRVLPAEVVVADQSSGVEARSAVAAADSRELPIRLVAGGTNGLAEAQNLAFRHTTQPVVAVIDDDCVADPEWILVLEQVFSRDRVIALIGGSVLPLGHEQPGRYAVASRLSATRQSFIGKAAPWHVGSGNNFAVRRDWFERVGGCDERLGPGTPGQGGLDMDLFYRVLRAGGRALYEPDAIVYHERATRHGRLARRRPYGHGIGVLCTLRLREGDSYGARLLAEWLILRARIVAGALIRKRWVAVHEEGLVLAGTAAGILHAIRAARIDRDGSLASHRTTRSR